MEELVAEILPQPELMVQIMVRLILEQPPHLYGMFAPHLSELFEQVVMVE